MLDPITITAGIATAKAVISGVRGALEMAKEAVDEIKQCAEAGRDVAESLGALGSFFSAAHKVEESIAAAKEIHPDKSDHEVVIEAMMAERQMRNFYIELREMFTYQFKEAGLFNEYMSRLEALREDRRKTAMEARLHEKAAEMAIKRKKAEQWQMMESAFAVILGGIVSIGIIYGIFLMFTFGGR